VIATSPIPAIRRGGTAVPVAVGLAMCMAVSLAGCAGDQTSSLGPLGALPPEAPRITGLERSADREHARLIAAFGGEYRAPEAARVLSEVAGRLVAVSERPDETYRITVLDSPVVNAFALPSGRLYVTRGLLALANDSAEAAAVLAHEIAHVTVRHASARNELEARSALVSRVVADVLDDPVAGAMVKDRSRFTLASFSRNQELEADQIGVRSLAKAGYDPFGASRFLAALGRASGTRAGGNASPDMLSTHPSTPERVSLAMQAARRVAAPGLGEADRARFLTSLDGMAYGDDPADGVVRGRRFIHPRLGIAFEAPDGVALENTSRAVVGASPDGSLRFLFDALAAPEDQTLEAVLQSTWNEAIEIGSITALTVNGRPVAVAASRGKDWAFRLAAFRARGTTYRLVLAAPPANADLERAFRQTLDSVREVTAAETRQLRPLRLRIVAAREGDTVDSLTRAMSGVDRPRERFLMLNGLGRGASVKPGEFYKVITE
jgi:predicted Zn-dependent protease